MALFVPFFLAVYEQAYITFSGIFVTNGAFSLLTILHTSMPMCFENIPNNRNCLFIFSLTGDILKFLSSLFENCYWNEGSVLFQNLSKKPVSQNKTEPLFKDTGFLTGPLLQYLQRDVFILIPVHFFLWERVISWQKLKFKEFFQRLYWK